MLYGVSLISLKIKSQWREAALAGGDLASPIEALMPWAAPAWEKRMARAFEESGSSRGALEPAPPPSLNRT